MRDIVKSAKVGGLAFPHAKALILARPTLVDVGLPSHEQIKDYHSSPMVDARLRFLDASARHYAITAPATAAHLMLQHAQVAEESSSLSGKGQPPDTCGACGTIVVADRKADTLAGESQTAKQRPKVPVTLPSPKLMASPLEIDIFEIKCAACHRITRKPAARHGAAGRNGPPKKQATTPAPPQSGALASENPPNRGPAQRPKARKRGGLQAMVERSRVSRESGLASGPDLMDFMRAG